MTKRFCLKEIDGVFYVIDDKYSTPVRYHQMTPKEIVNTLNSLVDDVQHWKLGLHTVIEDNNKQDEQIKKLKEENKILKELLEAAIEELKPKYDVLANYAKTRFMRFDDD